MIKRHSIYFVESKDNKNIDNVNSIKLGVLKDILYMGYHNKNLNFDDVQNVFEYVKSLEFNLGSDTQVVYGQYNDTIKLLNTVLN